jgi:hypothetical protein
MADPPRKPDSKGDCDVEPDRESTTGIPRWVWLSGIVAIIVVLLVAVLLLTGVGGEHGPSRHTSSGAHTPPASVPATVLVP